MPWFLPLVVAVGFFAFWLALQIAWRKRPAGFPAGEIVYRGHGRARAPTLHAPAYSLAGRPDFVVHSPDGYVPVEAKSGAKSKELYPSDRMQLVAEALLVEAEYGKRPEYGYIIYSDGFRKVAVRPKDVDKLGRTLKLMRDARRIGDLPDVHPSWFYCPTCPRTSCPMRAKRRARDDKP